MPGLARKVLICAAVEGLIIQPLSTKGQRPFKPVQIKYADASISSVSREHIPDISAADSSFEAFGVIGLITVSKLSYLVTITKRKQVAQIFGFPIYVVTGVAVTPCTSEPDATASIRRTVRWLDDGPPKADQDIESSDEDVELPSASADEIDDGESDGGDNDLPSSRSSVAEDVIRRKGSYGRFAQRWFSARGWTVDQRRTLGLSDTSNNSKLPETLGGPRKLPVTEEDAQGPATALLPKLLRAMYILFGKSRSFYFSYDMDITRRLSNKSQAAQADVPLYTGADEVFFWNKHMIRPLIEAGQDDLVLPLMQGFVGQKTFIADRSPPQVDEPKMESVELSNLTLKEPPVNSASSRNSLELRPSESKYSLTLISRRSTKRAGLRYLRRGIDENGFSANMVETEQILSRSSWDNSFPIYSFIQIRGSIPLFWTQTGYALKPVPVQQHSADENYKALKMHFESLARNYGLVQIVNLVEKQGVEKSIGDAYEKNILRLNEEGSCGRVPFEWFDFHHACRGMKFENVSELLLLLKNKLEEMGSTVQKGGNVTTSQSGTFRTNCMDCLDRTNVCQSSFARHMLEVQLRAEGIDMSAQLDQETMWFNTLWADNGDAVSKQYASTAAMKGDYTRTRKRNYMGALNDAGLSVARLYSGMVNDYFSQAAIDFLLGNVTGKVFDEFEADMMTKDPAVSVTRMRIRAIDLCQKRVIANAEEEVHGGWVLISPNAADVVKSFPMEEVVLLLTDAALYLCRFDWDLDKVSSFDRIDLANVTGIKFGTYISSTVSTAQMDELRNVGFVLSYQPGKSDVKRTNTRTISSQQDLIVTPTVDTTESSVKRQSGLVGFFSPRSKGPTGRQFAFKATYTDSSTAATRPGPKQTEIQQVVTICSEIERLVLDRQLRKDGEEPKSIIEKGDIISLDSAKRDTGLLEQLGHTIKKLVWA
ncbi:SacI domain protein [Cordyceps militaris CM01]|uniref:SacI domain protein n=1 Tax=Cordyceps militaris (strain CM01) TaxID=983644 RepID=G3J4K6_CORMM|nr:SacI domain protein [Cordyceps militaris CM01]EGX95876.1 SacI domain protein [Cordyceps militaris CM01]